MQQLDLLADSIEVIEIGEQLRCEEPVRVMDFPGLASQRVGTVIDFIPVHGYEGVYPLVLWDLGYRSVSSYAWSLQKVKEGQQLSLLPEVNHGTP